MGGSKIERLCADMYNGRIPSGNSMYRCGRMGGSNEEKIGTVVVEWEDSKWKG
jgi:hypothetical protein